MEASSRDCQLEYWNAVGPTKTFAHPVNVAQLRQLLTPSSRILDYGCGYGRVLGILHENGFLNLIGVDPAVEMIAMARHRFPSITFEILDDFRKVRLPDDSVDAVLLFAVLTCVPSDEGQRAIVDEATRLLRATGILYISDMCLQADSRNIERYQVGLKKYGVEGVFDLPEGVTVRHQPREWIDELTRDYQLIAAGDIQLQTMNGHAANGFQWLGRKRNLTTR